MLERLQERLLALLRVPPEPDPPRGDPASVRVFRAAPGYLRYRQLGWGLKQLGAVAGLASSIAFLSALETGVARLEGLPKLITRWTGWSWLELAETAAIGGFVIQLVPSLLLVLLDYRYRWYIVTDRSLRIREGLWKIQERTITFSNVQNVAVRQGPLQRLFGIADVRVQTAGGGGKESDGHEQGATDRLHVGTFRGVANAAEIRDAILARLRRLRTAGLGDPEEPVEMALGRAVAPARRLAARELLAEARSLAAVLREP